jgi:hypothetical protein
MLGIAPALWQNEDQAMKHSAQEAMQASSGPKGFLTMTPRRLLLLALPSVIVLLGIVGWLLWPAQATTTITRENAERIENGMAIEQVEKILGGPARDETTGPTRIFCATVPENVTSYWWMTDQLFVVACCDNDARVVYCECRPAHRVHEGFFEMLRRMLPW